MKCSFCGLEIREKLGFDTIFGKKEKFQLCTTCKEHIDINIIEVGSYSLYYFSDYEFIKEDIYSKKLFEKFFSMNNFDLVTIVPANSIREIIRGFDHIEQICKICDVKFVKLLGCEYREKQSKLHKERIENKYYFLSDTHSLENIKSILIIDDIYTSGTTLFGCAKIINEVYPNIKISFLTLSKTI